MSVKPGLPLSGPYDGNGTTGPWPFDFRAYDTSHLYLVLEDAEGVETEVTEGFTADGIGLPQGVVYYLVPVGSKVSIGLRVPLGQAVHLGQSGIAPPDLIEQGLDLLAQQIQNIRQLIGDLDTEDAAAAAAEAVAALATINAMVPTLEQLKNDTQAARDEAVAIVGGAPASAIVVTPGGNLEATDAQAALLELDADLTEEAQARADADAAMTDSFNDAIGQVADDVALLMAIRFS